MSQGDLFSITIGHWQIAMQTGFTAGLLAVVFSFGRLSSIQSTRWGVAAIAVLGTIIADFLTHPTHFGPSWAEAVVTGLGAGGLSLLVSLTPIDKAIAKLK